MGAPVLEFSPSNGDIVGHTGLPALRKPPESRRKIIKPNYASEINLLSEYASNDMNLSDKRPRDLQRRYFEAKYSTLGRATIAPEQQHRNGKRQFLHTQSAAEIGRVDDSPPQNDGSRAAGVSLHEDRGKAMGRRPRDNLGPMSDT